VRVRGETKVFNIIVKKKPYISLMLEAGNMEKFESDNEKITHWYICRYGNDYKGILKEDVAYNWLIKECVEIYYNNCSIEKFWIHWDSNKDQYTWEHEEGCVEFTSMIDWFIDLKSSYVISNDFIGNIYHGYNQAEFDKFVKFLEAHLQYCNQSLSL